MDNNLENMVEVGTEVADEAVTWLTPSRALMCLAGGAVVGVGVVLFVKYVAVPCVRKAKNTFGKKKDVLDLEEFEG